MEVEFLFGGSISRRRHKNRSAEANLFAVILVNKKEEEKRNKKIQEGFFTTVSLSINLCCDDDEIKIEKAVFLS